ncbi:zinc ribbon domain-containing protein [Streptosporangium roseum]|uniref:zinc ribbon domain-containing protein n=1 Tax=Streptosporangium roseum TaxID=2001 RepID=UPI001FE099F8|nr:zinc ribbon domain-containing protein [Streptosporangium roseum]
MPRQVRTSPGAAHDLGHHVVRCPNYRRPVLSGRVKTRLGELIAVNPAHTSRTCARCGHCARENRRTQAGFACTACVHAAHADVNAAINIFRAGLALRRAAQAAWREAAPLPLPQVPGGTFSPGGAGHILDQAVA